MDFLLGSKWLLLSNAKKVWLLRSCPLFIHLSLKKKKKKKYKTIYSVFYLIWFILPSSIWSLEYYWEYVTLHIKVVSLQGTILQFLMHLKSQYNNPSS